MVRVTTNDPPTILRYLDTGAHGAHIPWVNSAAEAERAVQSVKYSPRGMRGLAGSRASEWGLREPLSAYVERANRETLVVIQIETQDAVDAIDDYLAIDGVDVLFLGPTDLSQSLGHPGDLRHPDVLAALERVADAVVGSDKILGIYAGDGGHDPRVVGPRRALLHDVAGAVPAGRDDRRTWRTFEDDEAMKTIRLTTAQAIVRWLLAQRTRIDGEEVPIFAGVFAIFGHGNVTSLGEALEPVQDELPTYRGHNEQSMALAAVAYAKAMRGRRIMIATSSIGPGSTNMVTAAAVAHANRLPVLLLSGDTFQHRIVDPVLQQVEHFGDPTHHRDRRVQAREPLLGPDHEARPDRPVAAAGPGRDARPGDARAGVLRPAPGRPGRGVRLPGAVLRAEDPLHPPAGSGSARRGGGGRG